MALQAELLEQSFSEIKPQADNFADSFYNNLFAAYPEAKPLFANTDMAEQKKKLLNSLVLVVENLKNPNVLEDALRGLGARHVKYGALPAHYPMVGNALLNTFEQYLDNKWTPEVERAWIDAYEAITKIMLDGADYSDEEIAFDAPTKPKTEPEEPEAETTLQVELLEQSFGEVKPQANHFADSFYNNLFAAYPEAKPLFANTDMAEQKKKLLNSLVLVVENLKNPNVLGDALRGLGARHVKYGALPTHYPMVGNALLTTFEQYLGDKWTNDVKQAWVNAYGVITEIMLDGADYSDEEIAMNPPSAAEEVITAEESETQSTWVATEEVSNNAPAKFELAETDGKLDNSTVSATDRTVAMTNPGQAGLWALLGGGIMGVLALLLVLL